jgi:hypothetical protein
VPWNLQIRISRARHPKIKAAPVRLVSFLIFATLTLSTCLIFDGCRRPEGKQPLAPELRGPVKDLAAVRVGDLIWLSWSMPSKRLRNLTVDGSIEVLVCRRATTTGACIETGKPLNFAPAAAGSFSEKLPSEFASGKPRVLYYFVELIDRNGKSTGLSNAVATVAGAPPPVIRQLTAEMTDKGVLLRWLPDTSSESPADTAVQLYRVEVDQTPVKQAMRKDSSQSLSAGAGVDLLVENGSRSGQTIDANIRRGCTYEYRAQRVVRIVVGGKTIELPGQLSPAIRIDTADRLH